MKRKNKKECGFSLIEVIVSLIILASVFIGLVQVFPYALSISNSAKNVTIASYIAQARFEEINQIEYDNLATGILEPKTPIASNETYLKSFQRKTIIEFIDSGLNVLAVDIGMKRIGVTVYYIDPISKNEQSLEFKSIITQRN